MTSASCSAPRAVRKLLSLFGKRLAEILGSHCVFDRPGTDGDNVAERLFTVVTHPSMRLPLAKRAGRPSPR